MTETILVTPLGPPGISAYQAAVAAGYQGTPEEFAAAQVLNANNVTENVALVAAAGAAAVAEVYAAAPVAVQQAVDNNSASQAEAVAGALNTKGMTPLRVAQEVATQPREVMRSRIIPASWDSLAVAGYAAAGDGGAARVSRFPVSPGLPGAWQDASGAWFAPDEQTLSPGMLGAVAGASTAENYAAFTSLFGTPSRGQTIQLDARTYDLGATAVTVGLSSLYIKGVPGRTTITTSNKKLLVFGTTVSDIVISDINFVGTDVSSIQDFYSGLIWKPIGCSIRRVTFIRCTFSNPTSYASAVQFVCRTTDVTEGIYFYNCRVLGCGFIAVSVDNTSTDTTSRNFDWKWIGGSVENAGLVSPEYGQGISVSGFMDGFEIDTTFDNCKTIGFEGSGVCGLRMTGKVLNLRDTDTGNGGRAPVALTNNDGNLNLARKMTDNVLYDFTALDGTGGEMRVWDNDGFVSRNCKVKLNPSVAGTGSWTYVGSVNGRSSGDMIDSAGFFALECRRIDSAANPQGGRTANNSWTDLTIIHDRAPTAFQPMLNVGEGVDNNIIVTLNYTPKTPNQSLVTSTSETTLTGSLAAGPNVLTVTAQSGYAPIQPGAPGTGQRLYFPGMTMPPPTITAQLTGTPGGPGTYSYDGAGATVASGPLSAGRASKNFVRGPARRNDGYDMAQRGYAMAADADVNLNLVDTAPSLLSAPSLVITSAVPLTATRTILLPVGFPPTRLTNATSGGQALNFAGAEGGTNVVVANGVTATLGSMSAGLVRLD